MVNDAGQNRRLADGVVVLPFSVLLVIMNIIRILRIPITHDETGYSTHDAYLSLIFPNFASANNHVLHSVIRQFLVRTFSDTLFWIRADSLLAQVVFLVFSYLLCRRLFISQAWRLLAFFIFCTASPFVFDFWGLSRGYGLGLCLLTVSVYYLVAYHQQGRVRLLVWGFIASALTVYSNYAYINYYLSLCGAVILAWVIFKDGLYSRSAIRKELGVIVITSAALAALITRNLILLHSGGELQFLGNNGFVEDTVISLIDWNLYIPNKAHLCWIISDIVVAITVLMMVYWIAVRVINRKDSRFFSMQQRTAILMLMLLLLPVVTLVAQNKILGITYLVDRTALFFILLFIFSFIYFVYLATLKMPRAGFAVMVVVALVLGGNFFYNIEMDKTRLWWYDAGDMAVLHRLTDTWKNSKPIRLRVSGYNFPGVRWDVAHFYKDRFTEVEETHGDPPADTLADAYFIWSSDGGKLPAIYHADTSVCGGACVLYKKH